MKGVFFWKSPKFFGQNNWNFKQFPIMKYYPPIECDPIIWGSRLIGTPYGPSPNLFYRLFESSVSTLKCRQWLIFRPKLLTGLFNLPIIRTFILTTTTIRWRLRMALVPIQERLSVPLVSEMSVSWFTFVDGKFCFQN